MLPHPVVLLFGILLFVGTLSHLLPAGAYERALIDGRMRVVPNSYHYVAPTPLSLLDIFRTIPRGFKSAGEIIFVVLSSGIMFGVLEKSKMIENAVGTLVKRLGLRRRYLIVVLMTFLFGLLGVVVGYENNIALMPLAAITSLALGGDLVLAAGIAVGGVTIGFGLSPINPYTVGIGHTLAEMPLFSGALLRSALCFGAISILAAANVQYFKRIVADPQRSLSAGLDTQGLHLTQPLERYRMSANNWLVLSIFLSGLALMLYGIFMYSWYLNEISAVFLMVSILAGFSNGLSANELGELSLKSVAVVIPGAFMVGFATSIKVAMEMGNIGDTIAHELSLLLSGMPVYASALSMSLAQSVLNFLIPSGSGQALATLPVMIPLGELLGLTRQTTILAFQIGDGATNLLNPTLGGLIAMLGICRVPFDRWLRFIARPTLLILLLAWSFLLFSVWIRWGPI